MKKITTLFLTVVMMLCMSMSVMANDGGSEANPSVSKETDTVKPSGGGEEKSPKTGETAMPMAVAFAALAAAGVAGFAKKRMSE
ncbi:MAG: LPXTG cell wall anchor domain-containing protein [Lachnospiraceae bacterium]|nr:LPXTG cell wall anchor domain-containing protein [Lachnospiraceae bacterium]